MNRSFISNHPDLRRGKNYIDINQMIEPDIPTSDGDRTINYQDTTGSGFDKYLQADVAPLPERGTSDEELQNMPRVSDKKLTDAVKEEDAERDGLTYFDRDDYYSRQDLLIEGNEIYHKELKNYNKAHNVKIQRVEFGSLFNY